MNTYPPPYYFGVVESIMHETHDGMIKIYQKIDEAKKRWSQGLDSPVYSDMAILGSIVFSYPGIESKVVVSKGNEEDIDKAYLFDKTQYREFQDMKTSISEIAESFMTESISDRETLRNLLAGGIFGREFKRQVNIHLESSKPLGLKKEFSVLPFDGLALCLGSGDPTLEAKAIGLIDSYPRRERSLFNLVMLTEIEWTRMVKAFMEMRQRLVGQKSVLPLQEGKVSGQGIVILDTVTSSIITNMDIVSQEDRGPRLVAVRPFSAFLPYASYIQIMDRENWIVSGMQTGKELLLDDIELFLERFTLQHKGFSPFVWHSVCSRKGEWFAYRYSAEFKSLVIVRDIEMEVYRNKDSGLNIDARWLLSPFVPGIPRNAKGALDDWREHHELDFIAVFRGNFCKVMEDRGIQPLNWLSNLFKPRAIAKVDFSRIDCRVYSEYEKDAKVIKAMCSRGDIFEFPGMIRRVLLFAPKPCPKSDLERELKLTKGYWKAYIPYLDDIRNFSSRRRGYDFLETPYSAKNWELIEDNLSTESLFDWDFKFKKAVQYELELCSEEEEHWMDYSSDEEEAVSKYSTANWSNEDLGYDCSGCSEDDWRMHVNPGHWND